MTPDQLQADVVRKYSEHINPYLARLMNFAGFGVEIQAEGCIMRDQDGREYLDFLGGYGVFSLGHRNPKVVQAVKDQLDRMPLSGKTFFGSKQADLAEKIAQITPEGLQYTFFSNSGAEAVEAALKFAKGTTKRSKIVSTHGGYHGKNHRRTFGDWSREVPKAIRAVDAGSGFCELCRCGSGMRGN